MPLEASSRKGASAGLEFKFANSGGSGIASFDSPVENEEIPILRKPLFDGYARINYELAQMDDPNRFMRSAEQGFHWPIQRRCKKATLTG